MPAKAAWFGFGIDPIIQKVIAITIAETKEEAERHCRERRDSLGKELGAEDVISIGIFNLLTRDGVRQMRDWLLRCKVPRDEVQPLMLELLASLKRGPEKE